MPEVSIERLREIEWAGYNCGCSCCPVCYGIEPIKESIHEETILYNIPRGLMSKKARAAYGHQEGCWLAELLNPVVKIVRIYLKDEWMKGEL